MCSRRADTLPECLRSEWTPRTRQIGREGVVNAATTAGGGVWGSRGSTRATERDRMARGQRMSLQRRSRGNGCFATDVFAMEEARGRQTEDEIAALGSRDGGGLS